MGTKHAQKSQNISIYFGHAIAHGKRKKLFPRNALKGNVFQVSWRIEQPCNWH